jgi:GntR family transcriptional regulator
MTKEYADRSTARFGFRMGPGSRAPRVLQESPLRAHALLRSGIRTGVFAETERFVEESLVQSLATSRNAVRIALRMLATEGLVKRSTNVGTGVVRAPIEVNVLEVLPTIAETPPDAEPDVADSEAGLTLRQLDYGIIPATGVHKRTFDDDIESVFMRELLVSLNGEPAAVVVGYHPVDSAPVQLGDTIIRFTKGTSLAKMFTRLYNRELGAVESVVEAISCDERTARVLRTEVGAPLLVQETLANDVDGRPCVLYYTHWRGDRVSLRASDPFVRGTSAAPAPTVTPEVKDL